MTAAAFSNTWCYPLQFREILLALASTFHFKTSLFSWDFPFFCPAALHLDLPSLPISFSFVTWLGDLASDFCFFPVGSSWVPFPHLCVAWIQVWCIVDIKEVCDGLGKSPNAKVPGTLKPCKAGWTCRKPGTGVERLRLTGSCVKP